MESLQEVAAITPPHCQIHLALPSGILLFERMKLPSGDPAELRGMMHLQLEKNLPFSPEDVTADFQIVKQGESESVLFAFALNNSQLDVLCEPLRAAGLLPQKITVFAMQADAACQKIGVVLLIYREQEKFVAAISENGVTGFVQTIAGSDKAELLSELPQILLGAELDGVSCEFSLIQLEEGCAELRDDIVSLLGVPVGLLSLERPPEGPEINLFPATWKGAREAALRNARMKSRLMLAGSVYLALLLCAFCFYFGLAARVKKLDRALLQIQPDVTQLQTHKNRWSNLAPAVDPARYTIEILYQIQKCLPSDSIRITQFDQNKEQFMIEGEAPTAAVAIDFGEQLKNNPELTSFKFETAPPAFINNEHVQFRIFGKL